MAATIRQVAARAGVSTTTVSYVINGTGTVTEATRQRVLEAVAALRYEPSYAARSMRTRSRTLGLMVSGSAGRIAEPAFAEVLAGLAECAAEHGYSLLLAAPEADSAPADVCVALGRSGRVDGIILTEIESDDPRTIALEQAGIPYVCAGMAPNGSASVAVDIAQAAQLAVRHLLSLGHRRIGLIQLPSELVESEACYAGYDQALTDADVPPDPGLVIEAGRDDNDGYAAMQELLAATDGPTAVIASTDDLAFGALHAIHDAGLRVGSDISLIGMDDLPLAAHTQPPLTAVRRPRHKVGVQLADLLITLVEQRTPPNRNIVLAPRLIVRRSSGAPPSP